MPVATLPRPAERTAIISLLLVFLCGVTLGAVAMSYWHPVLHEKLNQTLHSNGLMISTQEWKDKLELTDDQTRQLSSVLADFSRYYDNLLADGNSRIMQILNQEQRRRYDQLIREHRK